MFHINIDDYGRKVGAHHKGFPFFLINPFEGKGFKYDLTKLLLGFVRLGMMLNVCWTMSMVIKVLKDINQVFGVF